MVVHEQPPRLINAKAMLETDVPGRRTFALQIRDDSMQPLFNEGEIVFVNPDLSREPGHYLVVETEEDGPKGALLRQLKAIGGQSFLHPLNRRYEDLPVTKQQRVLGRVVRLRKNL
jgi:SOS-response transcriptional repressor LexA